MGRDHSAISTKKLRTALDAVLTPKTPRATTCTVDYYAFEDEDNEVDEENKAKAKEKDENEIYQAPRTTPRVNLINER